MQKANPCVAGVGAGAPVLASAPSAAGGLQPPSRSQQSDALQCTLPIETRPHEPLWTDRKRAGDMLTAA